MTAEQYAADYVARLDLEILTAQRIAEQAEDAAARARIRRMSLISLRLAESLGGSGVWEPRGEHLTLEPRGNLAAWLTARVQLYTGGTQQWEIALLVRHRGKEATLGRALAPTPRQAMRMLVDSLDPDTRHGRAGTWAGDVLANAVVWDLRNAEQRAQLGLLRREGGR